MKIQPIQASRMHDRRSQSKLLGSCAMVLALAAAGRAETASAQSFDASSSVVSGTAFVTTGLGTTTIEIDSPEVVIDWTPTDTTGTGTINFQAAGTTATFQTSPSPGFGDYTVLNRILPVDAGGNPTARAVAFNGAVQSTFFGVPGNGNIWFYSPTGIIVGAGAVFNVGSLVLTTSDIDTTGGLFSGTGAIRFGAPGGVDSFITVNAGALLDAAGSDAYVALVAPRIEQFGRVQTNGSLAYVAAEQADVTFSAGLVDIAVTVGTEDANGIVHSGDGAVNGVTTGPATLAAGVVQTISMVAIPKNTALTMLLSGTIGYSPAASAAVEGSSIVLSAGVDATGFPSPGLANIEIGDATFTNALNATASDTIDVLPGTAAQFDGDTVLTGLQGVNLLAVPGSQIIGVGDLTLNSGFEYAGGAIAVTAQNTGVVQVGGTLTANADSPSPFLNVLPVGADGVGGSVTFLADGGSITALADMFLSANGTGEAADILAGNGLGGSIDVTVSNGGSIAGTFFDVGANGYGGYSDVESGDGLGGSIALSDLGGQFLFDTVYLAASGNGEISDAIGGDGIGGQVTVNLTSQAHAWNDFYVDAYASGAEASILGATSGSATAQANAVTVNITGTGALDIATSMYLSANAVVGLEGAAGYSAQAGGISLQVSGGGALDVTDDLVINADASVSTESGLPSFTRTADVTGGQVDILADGGSISATRFGVHTDAYGVGAPVTSGLASGGSSVVGAIDGGSLVATGGASVGDNNITADAYGHAGTAPAHALGGTATLYARDGTVNFADTTSVTANGLKNSMGTFLLGPSFDATGGTATVELQAGTLGTGVIGLDVLNVQASGFARDPIFETTPVFGDGGAGTGGLAQVSVAAGGFTATSVNLDAEGYGANSVSDVTQYQSGDGFGGTADFASSGGSSDAADIVISAAGYAGASTDPAVAGSLISLAGNGAGGQASLTISGGDVGAVGVVIDATGFGGNGVEHTAGTGGNGGSGSGGSAQLVMPGGSTGQLTATTLDIYAIGVGGDGGASSVGPDGDGGAGFGGTAGTDLADGRFDLGPVAINAEGTGGDGATGGDGTGGTAQFLLTDTGAAAIAPRVMGSLGLEASGIAGASLTGPIAQSTAGSLALTVEAAQAGAAVNVTNDFTANAVGTTAPAGNGFIGSVAGAPLTIDGAIAITTPRAVDIAVAAGASFGATTALSIDAGSVTSSGVISSGGNAQITAPLGIAMSDLQSGGTTLLQAAGGAVTVSTDLQAAGLVTLLGQAFDLTSTGALTFANASASAGDFLVDAAGDLAFGSVAATGAVSLVSTGGALNVTGAITGTDITLGALGAITPGAAVTAGNALTVSGGSVTSASPMSAGGNIQVTGTNGISLVLLQSGGTTLLSAPTGAIAIDQLLSAGLATVLGQSVDLTSTGSLSFADADATAGDLLVDAAGNLLFATIDASGAVTLTSGGTLGASGAINGGDVTLTAPGAVSTAAIAAAGTLAIAGDSLVSSGAMSSGGNAQIVVTQGIDLVALQSGGTTLLQGLNGAVAVSNDLQSTGLVTVLGQSVDLTSTGALSFADADATAGDLSVTAAGDLAFATVDASGAITLASSGGALANSGAVNGAAISLTALDDITAAGDLSAGGAVQIGTAGAFVGSAGVLGQTVDISSSDIVLAGSAQVGAAGVTDAITLTNANSANQTFVGGADMAGAYSLSATELNQLFADQAISVIVPGSAVADLVVGDFDLELSASGNLGPSGVFTLTTPGRILVNGQAALVADTVDGTFALNADRVELDTATGSIIMLGTNGGLSGSLQFTVNELLVASAAAIADIGAGLSTEAASDRLDIVDSAPSDGGYLQARAIGIAATNAVYIQNTGLSQELADRRGFSADSFAITTSSPGTSIAINGVVTSAATGLPATGLDTHGFVTIDGIAATSASGFDPQSTINGCVIGTDCVVVDPIDPTVRIITTKGELEEIVDPEGSDDLLLSPPRIEIRERREPVTPPLIDEPVTGVGNDDLWQVPCDGTTAC